MCVLTSLKRGALFGMRKKRHVRVGVGLGVVVRKRVCVRNMMFSYLRFKKTFIMCEVTEC